MTDHVVREDVDIRVDVPTCNVGDGYANGYGVSKWASETLLREVSDLFALPVSVFRPGMILADTRYDGQLNVPDIFTRLIYSLAITGVAPSSFYLKDGRGERTRAHYEGLPVDYLADAITAISHEASTGFHAYNVSSRQDDGISMDTLVDWLIDAGYLLQRVDDYDEWMARFEAAMRSLPDRQRQASVLAVLAVLDVYRVPMTADTGATDFSAEFEKGVRDVGREIPHLSADVVDKYVTGLKLAGLL